MGYDIYLVIHFKDLEAQYSWQPFVPVILDFLQKRWLKPPVPISNTYQTNKRLCMLINNDINTLVEHFFEINCKFDTEILLLKCLSVGMGETAFLKSSCSSGG